MRTGPHPLSTHIALAGAALQGEKSSDDAQKLMAEMLAGVKKYQGYGDLPMMAELPVVLRLGALRLLHIAADDTAEGGARKHPVLLVPSLINRYTIFDLYKTQSFARWLAAQGHHVYMIDWGDLAGDAGAANLDAVVRDRLNCCAEFAAGEHGAAVNAIGYCMGGTVLVGGACLAPDLYHTLVFIAAPWDFAAAGRVMLSNVMAWAPSALAHITTQPVLPCSHIQGLFASLYPEQAVEKFSRFATMEAGSAEEQLFVAVEDWLNDGVDLPHDVARSCIQGWFVENAPARGAWALGGDIVRPRDVAHPAFVVASSCDKLVAYKASEALYRALPQAEIYDPACGHIGMMAGRRSVENVWSPINAWLCEKDGV